MKLTPFLNRLESDIEPTQRTALWRTDLGGDVFDALAVARWLRPAEPAGSWPCEFNANDGCPRVVRENLHDAEHADAPYVALCAADPFDPYCHDVLLRAEDLVQDRASLDAMFDVLRSLFDVHGRASGDPLAAPKTYKLGERYAPGAHVELRLLDEVLTLEGGTLAVAGPRPLCLGACVRAAHGGAHHSRW